MSLKAEIDSIIGKSESETLEYKAVLPPSRSIAQILSAFANTKGGYLVLGVNETKGKPIISGLSKDFHASTITQKAVELLSPKPMIAYDYVEYDGKTLFIIKVEKSTASVLVQGKTFIRIGDKTSLAEPSSPAFRRTGYMRIADYSNTLDGYTETATGAKTKFIDHFQSVLRIIDDLDNLLFPDGADTITTNQEGKILTRILFSSLADNFETYLSDLLYEIYLANPNTLKSEEMVTIQDVLNCTDIEEFVDFWAKRKLGKLQRGSIKGFVAENKQINSLGVIGNTQQEELERILQIRHLYAHKNGIVDEKFMKYYPSQFEQNQEHQMTIDSVIDKMEYLASMVHCVDIAAVHKHSLATVG